MATIVIVHYTNNQSKKLIRLAVAYWKKQEVLMKTICDVCLKGLICQLSGTKRKCKSPILPRFVPKKDRRKLPRKHLGRTSNE
jgi:hypothetical protein